MSVTSDKYIISGMSTVIICSVEGLNLSKKEELTKLETKVDKKVKEIILDLKKSNAKFIDPDFGPKDNDEFGAVSLYGDAGKPDPAGSKYPDPDTLIWDRPHYADGTGLTSGGDEGVEGEEEEEYDEDDEDDDYGFSYSTTEKVIVTFVRFFSSCYFLRSFANKVPCLLMVVPLEM
jgi:hypothetical protein